MTLFFRSVPNPPHGNYKAERTPTMQELGRLAEEYRNAKAEWDAREELRDTDPWTVVGKLERDFVATRFLKIEDEYTKALNSYHQSELEKLFDVN